VLLCSPCLIEPCTRLHTSEDYKEQVVKRWKEIESRRCLTDDPKRRAVLLDCFAGVGTGAVCLKRLGIAVEKVIYVDIDKVARHVYRHNHDAMFSTKEGMYDDGIEHVYEYKSFEEVESNLGTFFDRHGRKLMLNATELDSPSITQQLIL